MYIPYPVSNFRCPSCGAKMPTEQYSGWRPWVCPSCSEEWQFSQMHGTVVQLCSWVLVFIALYAMRYRGWELFLLTFLGGVALTIIVAGPLDLVIPPRLEPYEAPFWALQSGTRGKSILGLSEVQNASSDTQNIEPHEQSEPKTPRSQ